jgi:hypothetical protein
VRSRLYSGSLQTDIALRNASRLIPISIAPQPQCAAASANWPPTPRPGSTGRLLLQLLRLLFLRQAAGLRYESKKESRAFVYLTFRPDRSTMLFDKQARHYFQEGSKRGEMARFVHSCDIATKA